MGRHRLTIALAACLILAISITPAIGSAGIQQDDDESAVDFRAVAEQELTLDDDSLVWQAGELRTFADGEHPIPFFTGFLYAHNAPLVIYRNGGNRFTRLGTDKAMPIETGALLAPVAVRGDDETFLALELVAEDDAHDPAGEPFTPEAGDYVLELLRAESGQTDEAEDDEDRDDPVRLNDAELPVLLVVVAGEVEVTVDDEDAEELRAGDVMAVADDFDLRWLGEEPGVVLAAVLRLSGEDDDEANDDESDVRPARTPSGDTGQDDDSSGDDESDPTPTPGPTEEPGSDPVGNLPGEPPPPDDTPGGGSGGGSGGSSSGGVGVEQGPSGGGECLYCAPADDDLFDDSVAGDPCLLADGGGDSDSDGLNNCAEAAAGTYPTIQDSDQDGAWDGDEVRIGTNPTRPDTDGDLLRDGDEILVYFSNPFSTDTDDDGIIDGDEVHTFGTNPNAADTDGDGLWDLDEINRYTYPTDRDSDNDCLNDGYEVSWGSSPINGNTDGDKYGDNFENGVSDPTDPNDEPGIFEDLGDCVL